MRRFIAYLGLSFTILFSVGVAFTPTFTKMNANREYGKSYGVTYQIEGIKNEEDEKDDDTIVNDIANEMKDRLKTYGVDDFSIKVQGNDKINVNFSAKNETFFETVKEYLSFNGENFCLATKGKDGTVDGKVEAKDVFGEGKDAKAKIEYKNLVPEVIFPIKDSSKIQSLIDMYKDEVEDKSVEKAPDPEEKAPAQNYIYLLANLDDEKSEDFNKIEADKENTGKKLIASFPADSEKIWKDSEKKDSIIFISGFVDSENKYDFSKIEEANDQAIRLCNLFNASSYGEHEIKTIFTDNETINPSVENLLKLGDGVLTLSLSMTLISSLIGALIISLLLVLFYRAGAIGIIANTVGTVYLTILLTIIIKTTFNIALLVGVLLVAVASLATGIFYMSKFKEEVYRGRTFKKAHQEASKKLNLMSIDIAVIVGFIGLMCFALAGDLLKPFGVALFFGAIIMIVMNLVTFKILNYLLANTTALQDNYKIYNIEAIHVPSINDKEEKPIYKGPYEKTDFTKRKKLIGGLTGVLSGAMLIAMIAFGVTNGHVLHYNESPKTVVYVDLTTKEDVRLIDLQNEDIFKDKVIANIRHGENNEELSDYKLELKKHDDSVILEDNTNFDVTHHYYYVLTFDHNYMEDNTFKVVTSVSKDAEGNEELEFDENTVGGVSLKEALDARIIENINVESYADVTDKSISMSLSNDLVTEPHLGWIALASTIGLLGASLYLCFRFRVSRGVSALIMSGTIGLMSVGALSITYLTATPIVGLALPFIICFSLISMLYYFNREKDLLIEEKASGLDKEKRRTIMKEATSYGTSSLFILVILSAYLAINFFGFGPSAFALLNGLILIGVALSALLVPTLSGELALGLEKLKIKIKIKPREVKEKKTRIKLKGKPKTNEPEETIFIGIND